MSDRRGALARWVSALASRTRFGKFVSVGVVGATVDTTALFLLVQFGGLPAVWVNFATIELAILVMFGINDRWTFAAHGQGASLPRRLVRSHAVRATGTTAQILVFTLLYEFVAVSLLAGVDLWLLVAKGAGIGLGMLLNYVFETLFTWRVQSVSER